MSRRWRKLSRWIDFGRGGWMPIDGVRYQRWHLFLGRHHRVFYTRLRRQDDP